MHSSPSSQRASFGVLTISSATSSQLSSVQSTPSSTGGGGDPYIGKLMAEQAIDEHGPVRVADIDEFDDDALIMPVAMMGAPTVMLEKLPKGTEVGTALSALEAYLGQKADAIFCVAKNVMPHSASRWL